MVKFGFAAITSILLLPCVICCDQSWTRIDLCFLKEKSGGKLTVMIILIPSEEQKSKHESQTFIDATNVDEKLQKGAELALYHLDIWIEVDFYTVQNLTLRVTFRAFVRSINRTLVHIYECLTTLAIIERQPNI